MRGKLPNQIPNYCSKSRRRLFKSFKNMVKFIKDKVLHNFMTKYDIDLNLLTKSKCKQIHMQF